MFRTPLRKALFLFLPLMVSCCFGQQIPGYGLYGQGLSVDTSIVCDKTAGCTFSPGAKIAAEPSPTTAGLNLGGAILPSAGVAGDVAMDGDFNLNWYNGSNWVMAPWMAQGTTFAAGLPVVGMGGMQIGTGSATGSGSFVLSTLPTISNPTITSFVNSNHDHSNPANGGGLSVDAFNGGTNASSSTFLRGDGTWASPPASVGSVFGRTGTVMPQAGDYTAAQVTNAVDDSQTYNDPSWLNSLSYSKLINVPSTVGSFNGRTGSIMPQAGDYTAAQVTNAVDGSQTYNDPVWLNSLSYSKLINVPSTVGSFNGRTGSITPQAGDYTAAQVSALGDSGANGIVKRTASNTTAAAVAGDVVTLFSNCSGTQYLGADGNCHSLLPVTLSSQWSFSTTDMISTDGAVYDGVVSTNACSGGCGDTTFSKSFTIPANALGQGNTYRVTMGFVGTASSTGDVGNILIKVNLGGNTCFASNNALHSPIENPATNSGFNITAFIIGTAVSSSSAVVDCNILSSGWTGNENVLINSIFAPTFATNAPLPATVSFRFSSNTAGNMYAMRSMLVEQMY